MSFECSKIAPSCLGSVWGSLVPYSLAWHTEELASESFSEGQHKQLQQSIAVLRLGPLGEAKWAVAQHITYWAGYKRGWKEGEENDHPFIPHPPTPPTPDLRNKTPHSAGRKREGTNCHAEWYRTDLSVFESSTRWLFICVFSAWLRCLKCTLALTYDAGWVVQ